MLVRVIWSHSPGNTYCVLFSRFSCVFSDKLQPRTFLTTFLSVPIAPLGNGESIRREAVRLLDLLAVTTGEPSAELKTLFDNYFNNKNLDYLYEMTRNSSAVNFINEINNNKPAIFIANAYGDSLFTPNQFPSFWNALKGNKHLEFSPGDHAGPELPGILGLPNAVWTRAGKCLFVCVICCCLC